MATDTQGASEEEGVTELAVVEAVMSESQNQITKEKNRHGANGQEPTSEAAISQESSKDSETASDATKATCTNKNAELADKKSCSENVPTDQPESPHAQGANEEP